MIGALLIAALIVQDPAAGEGAAREAIRKAADVLKKAQSLSYPITWIIPGSSGTTRYECRVKARRPGQLRQEGAFLAYQRNDPCIIVLDGTTEWCLHDMPAGRYFKRPQVINPPTSTWEDPIKLFFFDEPFTSWMEFATDLNVKPEKLDGAACSVIEWRIRYTTDISWRLWIDESHRIRRLEKFLGDKGLMQVEVGPLTIDPKVEDDTFKLNLPPGAKQDRGLGEYESKLIAVGAEAPAFEARTVDGKDVRVSDWKGKPVLFLTWSFP